MQAAQDNQNNPKNQQDHKDQKKNQDQIPKLTHHAPHPHPHQTPAHVQPIKFWSNTQLQESFTQLVSRERKITHAILLHIAELDRRQLYLQLGYSTLFEYLVKGHGYSEGAAHRRLSAARLLRESPELKQAIVEKLQSGALHLSHLTELSRATKQVKLKQKRSVSTVEKLELLSTLSHSTKLETQTHLAEKLGLDPKEEEMRTQVRGHGESAVSVSLYFTAEEMRLLEEVRSVTSHASGMDWKQVILHLATRELARRQKSKFAKQVVSSQGLPATVLGQQPVCQYQDPKTGKRCESRHYLQIDHRQPRWAGGGDESQNLQVLCAAHNQWRYRQQSGVRARH